MNFRKNKKLVIAICAIPVLVLAGMKFYVWAGTAWCIHQGEQVITRYAQIHYASLDTNLDGTMVLKNIRLVPHQSSEQPITIDQVQINLHSFPALLAYITPLPGLPNTRHLTVTATGVHMQHTFTALFEQNQTLHADWSRLQTLACGNIAAIDTDALQIMGYSNFLSNLEFDYHFPNAQEPITISLNAQTQDIQEFALKAQVSPANATAAPLALQQLDLHSLSLHYQDFNFSPKFAKFCADHRRINQDDFLQEHVTLLRAGLKNQDIELGEAIWTAYENFFTTSGAVHVLIQPAEQFAIGSANLYNPSDIVAWLAPQLWINQQRVEPVELNWQHTVVAKPAPPPVIETLEVVAVVQEKVRETSSVKSAKKPKVASYKRVTFAGLQQHQGRHTKITTTSGETHAGYVESTRTDAAIINKRMYGGNMSIPIPRSEIRQILVFY